MKKFLPALTLVVAVGLVLAVIYKDRIVTRLTGDGIGEQRANADPRLNWRNRANAERAVPVLAEQAAIADMPVFLSGVGTVRAHNMAVVRAQLSGRLTAVHYKEGQEVKKGDLLAEIDPVTHQAAYDQAVAKKAINEALLANARRDLDRYKTLAKSQYGSEKQADTQESTVAQLEAQLRQDQAAIDSAKANLDYTRIKAPIDGRTGISEVDVGNLVTPGDANGIAVIMQLQPVSVLFTLPESHIADLIEAKRHGKVPLTAAIGGKSVGEGELEVIDNRIDQTTGSVRLKGTFANERLSLWPGQFVHIRLQLKMINDATVIPAVAVQQGATSRYVYVVQPDSTAKLTNITVAQENETQAVIASGIHPGDMIVTAGFASLKDGSKISIDRVESEPQATSSTEDPPKASPEIERSGAPDDQRMHRNIGGSSAFAAEPSRLPNPSTDATPERQGRER